MMSMLRAATSMRVGNSRQASPPALSVSRRWTNSAACASPSFCGQAVAPVSNWPSRHSRQRQGDRLFDQQRRSAGSERLLDDRASYLRLRDDVHQLRLLLPKHLGHVCVAACNAELVASRLKLVGVAVAQRYQLNRAAVEHG